MFLYLLSLFLISTGEIKGIQCTDHADMALFWGPMALSIWVEDAKEGRVVQILLGALL